MGGQVWPAGKTVRVGAQGAELMDMAAPEKNDEWPCAVACVCVPPPECLHSCARK